MIPSEYAIELAEGTRFSEEDVEYFLRRCPSFAPPELVRDGFEILCEHDPGDLDLRKVADAMTIHRATP